MTDSAGKHEALDTEDAGPDGAEGAPAPEAPDEPHATADGEPSYAGPKGAATAGAGASAGGAGGATATDDGALAALQSEYDKLNDRHLRLAAEFNNFRRRSEQERLSAWARAQSELMARFLDVLDDLHRVAELDLDSATVEAIMEGIDLVERKFVRGLEEAGAEMLDPTGMPFDPELMEAMMRVPAESDEQADTVAQVFQKGYSLKGVLVRPARVSVYTQ